MAPNRDRSNPNGRKLIASNRRARHDYAIVDEIEAGMVLTGSEVKALREGHAQIADAFAKVDRGQVWLHNAHIDEYGWATHEVHAPKAPRKLLLNTREINKLHAAVARHCGGKPGSFSAEEKIVFLALQG